MRKIHATFLLRSIVISLFVTLGAALLGNTDKAVVWFDDALPKGASGWGPNSAPLKWVTADPAPYSGDKALQTNIGSGLHEYAFNWAGEKLNVDSDARLFAYVYLDPHNIPIEVMLSFWAQTWEHRAYWGDNRISNGKDGTDSRRYMGPLPKAGGWYRLEVPASSIGLEGASLNGMSFSLFGGRATFDRVGVSPILPSVTIAVDNPDPMIGDTDDIAAVTLTRSGASVNHPLTVHLSFGGSATSLVDYRCVDGYMPNQVVIPAGSDSTSLNIVAIDNVNKAEPATAILSIAQDAAYTNADSASVTITLMPPPPAPVEPPSTDSVVWFDSGLPTGASGNGWNWVNGSPKPFSGSAVHQTAVKSGIHEYAFNWARSTLSIDDGDILYAYVYLDPANPPSEVMLSFKADTWEHRAYWGSNVIQYGKNDTNSRRRIGDLPQTGTWARLEVPAADVGLANKSINGLSFSLAGGRAWLDSVGKGIAAAPEPEPEPAPEPEPDPVDPTPPVTPALSVVTITADDNKAVIGDSSNTAAVTFTRTGSLDDSMRVGFALGGSAVKWIDYRRVQGDMPVEAIIPAGESSTTFTIRAVSNVTGADPATVSFTLTARPEYTIGASNSVLIALMNDASDDLPEDNGDVDGGDIGDEEPGDEEPVEPPISHPNSYDIAGRPEACAVDYMTLSRPEVGDHALRILSPTVIELQRITTKAAGASSVSAWNFVDSSGAFSAPGIGQFVVKVNGETVPVTGVGFKRRVLSAPLVGYDVRIENALYLRMAAPIPANATVAVSNPTAQLWPSSMRFEAQSHPLRYSPAIHVNQEGYLPEYSKRAQVGYYVGNLGEMEIPVDSGFELVEVATGKVAFKGTLTPRRDIGFSITPTPYQQVFEANFSEFRTAGEYYLVVPGLGASMPFMIDNGVAMKFTRTYALGLYHQRSGAPIEMPFTRFTHGGGHTTPVEVPFNSTTFSFTWGVIAAEAQKVNSNNPKQTAPVLTSPDKQLFPFINKGPLNITRGHHDAGDYSKYTINSASLIHFLMLGVDALNGVSELDNLGLPESGDGIADVMQLAKWEADFLLTMQDADGGFYFLVYPRNRRYESNVLPDAGDPQIVWPKNTAATAAATAALAEIASSPQFKKAYPLESQRYMEVAHRGWTFLMNAIAKHGKAGSYQKITHYGDDFTHDDELAWAAAAMYVATGDQAIHNTLRSWYDPSNPSTWRWGWWRGYMSYGNAVRTYTFAARSGRLPASSLDPVYLGKAEAEIIAAGNDNRRWSNESAYGTSFPDHSKGVRSAGWYFSSSSALDITVANQIAPKPEYVDAVIANLNYEAGSNPVNVAYITGLGQRRQQEIVHQYAQNDRRVMPPSGIPLGNLQTGPIHTPTYGTELRELSFPRDDVWVAPYPLYDRWSDTFNVATEFVHLDQARSLVSLAALAAKTPLKAQAWRSGALAITGLPTSLKAGETIVVGLSAPDFDLECATIVWEAAGQSPAFGSTYSFTAGSYGDQWIEAEVTLPDGRRLFAVKNFFADNDKPNVSVVATDAYAQIGNASDTAVFTFSRSGDTSQALTVEFQLGGSAVKWNDYRRPEGDMPTTVTIPAGSSSQILKIRAVANSTGADPLTVDLTVKPGTHYNAVNPRLATVTLHTDLITEVVTEVVSTVSLSATTESESETSLDTADYFESDPIDNAQDVDASTVNEIQDPVVGETTVAGPIVSDTEVGTGLPVPGIASLGDAADLGDGLWSSSWFGLFFSTPDMGGWINSDQHGWIYIWTNQTLGQMWLWDPGLTEVMGFNGFVYTSDVYYPYVYISGGGWALYQGTSMETMTRSFLMVETNTTISASAWAGPLQTR